MTALDGLTGAILFVLTAVVAYLVYNSASLSKSLRTVTHSLEAANSRRETLEARLDQLDAEHTTLMAECGIGIVVLTPDGVVEHANATAAQYFSTRPAQMTGKKLLAATLSNELRDLFATAVNPETQDDSPAAGSVTQELLVRSGAAEYHLRVTIATIEHDQRTVRRVLLIAQDVSDLRRLEMIRRDFVANVSHELRTPLTSIRAAAETLPQGPPGDKAFIDRFTQMIVTEAERLTRISDDLLVLSAAESHVPVKSEVDLSPIIARVMNRVVAQSEKNGIQLERDIPARLSMMGNADQLEQVVWNLVDNAIKYTQSGGNVRVTGTNSGNLISINVADTGIGILQQDLPRIFERFYRVDKARSRETGGTGLGLSIVKHIVEAHGGHVMVESEYNRGSTFTIVLPVS